MDNQKHTDTRTNPWLFALKTGFYAGLIWGFIYILGYYLGFTKVIPGLLAEPFFKHDYLASWRGHLIGWIFFIVFSILASLLYVAVLRKAKSPWPGFGYGVLWWGIVFGLGPLLGMMKPIYQLDLNSLLTSSSIFLFWGCFIGYTISVEFNDETLREPFDNFKEESSQETGQEQTEGS